MGKQAVKEIKEEKKEAKKEAPAPKQPKSKRRHVPKAKAYILCSYNNTIISITDLNGNMLGWASAGASGFKGTKKSTPYAATIAAQKAIEKVARFGVKEVDIFVKGVGSGRETAIRAIGNTGIQTSVIKDITPVPHNGCRPPKPRRV